VLQLRRYLLKVIRRFMSGEEPPRLADGASYTNIDTRMVIVPTSTSFEDILAHREWTWGDVPTASATKERGSP
jgi:hypothetical protein